MPSEYRQQIARERKEAPPVRAVSLSVGDIALGVFLGNLATVPIIWIVVAIIASAS